jgi:hypothetical protein
MRQRAAGTARPVLDSLFQILRLSCPVIPSGKGSTRYHGFRRLLRFPRALTLQHSAAWCAPPRGRRRPFRYLPSDWQKLLLRTGVFLCAAKIERGIRFQAQHPGGALAIEASRQANRAGTLRCQSDRAERVGNTVRAVQVARAPGPRKARGV